MGPGEGDGAGLWPVFLATFAAGFATAFGIFRSLQWGIAALCVVLVGAIFGLMHGLRRIERFFVGARGEERVSQLLSALPDKYHVFNDFVAGSFHVDHVVAGPAGVFAIETKFWRGKVSIEDGRILVDGRRPSRSPLVQVQREASAVKAALEKSGWNGAVTPLLVFASDSFDSRMAELNGVVVLNSSELLGGFTTERVVVAPDELDRLISLMENNI
jgi:hypothetical protein